jgi:hypothetical protein
VRVTGATSERWALGDSWNLVPGPWDQLSCDQALGCDVEPCYCTGLENRTGLASKNRDHVSMPRDYHASHPSAMQHKGAREVWALVPRKFMPRNFGYDLSRLEAALLPISSFLPPRTILEVTISGPFRSERWLRKGHANMSHMH